MLTLADACPRCIQNVEPPKSVIDLPNARRAAYHCSDCGHAWTTDWSTS